MMDKRTTVVLSIVAGLLLAFILVFERDTLSTSEVARRSGHVLTRFVRDRVTRVELVRGDEPAIVFEREAPAEDEEEGALGDFRLSAPVAGRADQDAVESFLGALEWLMAKRTLDGITAEDRERYGLHEPRFVVRFRVAGENVALRVGGQAPEGQGVYVGVEGEDRAYVVDEDFVESIDHDAAHFRAKELFPHDFYASDARSIRLAGEGRATVRFEKDGDTWNVREPVEGLANKGAIDRLTRLAREARIARFVDEDAQDLARYGLDRPWRELVMQRPENARGTRSARLRVGGVCGEHTDERYAIVADSGPVVCVLASDLDALELQESELREGRLLAVGADAVKRVVLEGAGPRLELTREESGWRMRSGEGEPVAADSAAVEAWIDALKGSRAAAFEPMDGDAPGHGLASPRATLTIERSDADTDTVLRLGDVRGDGAWVRRGDERLAVRFDAQVAELFAATPLRFRDRAVVSEQAAQARSVVVRSDGIEQRAVRGEGGTWRLEAPIEAEADRVVVRELVRKVAELRAERFVAASAAPEHGLGARTVTVRFEPEGEEARTVTLTLGASTEGGVFARREGDDAVFVVAQDVVDTLDDALVSLDLLSIETSDAQSIRIEREGRVVADLRREGNAWRTADGGEPDSERTRELLDKLSTLRASGVLRYGATDATLDPPATRVTVTRPDGEVAIELGADQGEGDGVFVPARRSDVGVLYRLRPDVVTILRTYVP